MRTNIQVTELDEVQWDELQTMVPAHGYVFNEGMTRVCTVFGGPGNQERHVEIPLMVLAKLLARLAHVGHAPTAEFNRRPDRVIAPAWDRAEPRDTGPLDPSWHDMRTSAER